MSIQKRSNTHSFLIEDAETYGVDKAIILYNIRFWLQHEFENIDKGAKVHDGYVWTYNSAQAYSKQFPYFSSKKISRLLKELEDDGVLITGNYNKKAYDRTKWYTMPEYKVSDSAISQNWEMDVSKMGNAFPEIEQPIPDINTDKKPDNNITSFTNDSSAKIDMNFCKQVVDKYNAKLGHNFAVAQKINKTRIKLFKNIFKEFPKFNELSKWDDLFELISHSWLMKNNGTGGGFKVGIDWILTEKNFVKIVEGTYN